jgi:nicotinamidase-related amidase
VEPRILFGSDFFKLDKANTALLVIDMQNEFVEKGAHYTAYPTSIDIIPNIDRILSLAREHKMPVIWTQSDHSFPYGGLMLKKYPPIAQEKVLWRNTRSFEIFTNMTQPLANEYRVVKHKYDAFFGTDLDLILRNLKIESLVITGIATDVCCESTARSAFFREYQVAFISDATSTFDPEAHKATLKVINLFFGRVMTTDEVVRELTASIPIAAAPIR